MNRVRVRVLASKVQILSSVSYILDLFTLKYYTKVSEVRYENRNAKIKL